MKALILGLALLGSALAVQSASADTKTVGNWRIVTPDAQSIIVTIADASNTFGLNFRCTAKTFTLDLAPTNIENQLPDVNKYALKIRMDRNPALPGIGEPNAKGALAIDNAGPFLAGFIGANQFAIGIQSPDGGLINLTFQPKMTSAAFTDFIKACPAS